MTLIELDRTARPDQTPSPLPPARRYRTAGLLLAAVLALAAGAAAPPGRLLWRYLGVVPADAGPDSSFRLDGDRVYTVIGMGNDRRLAAWSLDEPVRRLWSVGFPARVAGPDQVPFGDVEVHRAGDVVLVSDGPATTALAARTGAVRWRSPEPVQPLDGDRIGLIQEPLFQPGTLYDQDSGAPGPLYFSAVGEPHTEPPIRTVLRGVDLRTGGTLWSKSLPGSVQVLSGGALVVLSANWLTRRSPATGEVLREAPLSPIHGVLTPSSAEMVGDAVVVRFGDDSADWRWLAGYALDTLQRRWGRDEDKAQVDEDGCDGVVCARNGTGNAVLDPAGGRVLWSAPAGVDLSRRGAGVLELRGDPAAPVRLVDPVTGGTRLDLRGWRSDLGSARSADGSPAVLLRRDAESGGSAFGVVAGEPARVRLLGTSRGPVGECTADERFVACRAAGGLQIFSYRD